MPELLLSRPAPTTLALEAGVPAGPRIVVADDDATTRLILASVLSEDGYQVAEAATGTEALHRIRETKPALVILDVMMPGADGLEVTRALRGPRGVDGPPVLILTGQEEDEAVTRAFDAGATDFASKPISPALLRHRVRFLLRNAEAVARVRRSEAGLITAQRIASLGSWDWHLSSGMLFCSRQALLLLGLDPGENRLLFDEYLARVVPEDQAGVREALEAVRDREVAADRRHRVALPDGGLRHLHARAELERDAEGRPAVVRGTIQDITALVEAEDRIRYLALFDQVTGLPNRRHFEEALRQVLAGARRQGSPAAVLILDLDHFKAINEAWGHSVGDAVLSAVGSRIHTAIRRSDTVGRGEPDEDSLVARLGGDEFLIALRAIDRGESAAVVATRLQEALRAPFRVAGHDIHVSACIGITIFPNDGADVEELLRHAGGALHHAKGAGRGSFEFFNRSLSQAVAARLTLENALRRAVEEEEFALAYQPQVDRAGVLVGAEALLRWVPTDGRVVPTASIIPVIEEAGLIGAVGEWVLRTALRHLKRWDAQGLHLAHVSVNVSGRQLGQPNLVQRFAGLVAEAGLQPGRVVLEITEGVLIEHPGAGAILEEFRALGFRIALDDFGTGYSALSYLRRFPIDVLKIDRSFTHELPDDRRQRALVRAIIVMASELGIVPVVEGIETAAQRDFIVDAGCHTMQGHLFGRPMDVEEFERRLAGLANGTATIP